MVWLGVAMSEKGEYNVGAKIEIVGYDTLRYAMVKADTSLTLRVRASGYAAFMHSLSRKPFVLQARVIGEGLQQSIAVDQISPELRNKMRGAELLDAGVDSIRVVFAQRGSKSYVPQIDGAEFTFADSYGLYGEPVVEPSEVMLSGADEALQRIAELRVEKTIIENISESGWHTLPLEPVWQKEVGVKPSCRAVRVYVPVEAYVERQYKVPITVKGLDTSSTVRLYPSEVKVNVWVAHRDIHRVPQISVEINYEDILKGNGQLSPSLVQFPSFMRLRSIEPDVVQCVMIK